MNARSALFLAVGIVLAGLTGWLVYDRSGQDAPAAAAAAPASVRIVVAKQAIPARTVVTADHLTLRSLPSDAVPPEAIRAAGEATGLTTLAAVPAGVPLVRSQLADVEGRTGASIWVAPGKVLVAFPTSDPLTVGGLISVGDRVDVLATVISGEGENARKTQTTVQDLEVVEVIRATKQEPSRATALTFVVDHQVALVLKYLRDAKATIDLAVRSADERQVHQTTSVDLNYLMETYGITK